MITRMKKWADKRHKIEMACVMLNDRLTMLENRVDALEEEISHLDTHDEYLDRFDEMFDNPLDTLEEVFNI